MELRERERGFQNRRESNIYNYTVVHLPAATVVAVMVSCSVPPPVIVAMTVMEYSVPSSRPVSVYIVSIPPAMSGIMVAESGIQAVSLLE